MLWLVTMHFIRNKIVHSIDWFYIHYTASFAKELLLQTFIIS